ncbi:hypothetical protein FOZ62_019863 [Perkinsus olseni]|uniref:Response regulatory domain-containing protein n=1 Tax=Perkinsus olseni TaxID=32597 RepID=A0A7J6PAH4_PEROL|nr:hypothetical protein FOZ62_019863 [Perkinsus olseni]
MLTVGGGGPNIEDIEIEDPVVLSVDDDPVNQMVMHSLLTAAGYRVDQAMDGFECLEYLANNELPNLILLDAVMPGMSGYDVARKLREDYPPQLPIMMISAKSSTGDVVKGLGFTCNDYLTKPFVKEEVLARIETQVNHRVRVSIGHRLTMANSVKLNAFIDRAQKTAHDTAMLKFLLGDALMHRYLETFDEAGVLNPHQVGLKTSTDLSCQGRGGATIVMMKPSESITSVEELKSFSKACILFEKMVQNLAGREEGAKLIHANQHLCAVLSGRPNHAADALLFTTTYLDALETIPDTSRPGVKLVVHTTAESAEPLVTGVVGEWMPRRFLLGNVTRLAQYILNDVPLVASHDRDCALITDTCVKGLPASWTLTEYVEISKVVAVDEEGVEELGEPVLVYALGSPTTADQMLSGGKSYVEEKHEGGDAEQASLRAQLKTLESIQDDIMAEAESLVSASAAPLEEASPPETWSTEEGRRGLQRLLEERRTRQSGSQSEKEAAACGGEITPESRNLLEAFTELKKHSLHDGVVFLKCILASATGPHQLGEAVDVVLTETPSVISRLESLEKGKDLGDGEDTFTPAQRKLFSDRSWASSGSSRDLGDSSRSERLNSDDWERGGLEKGRESSRLPRRGLDAIAAAAEVEPEHGSMDDDDGRMEFKGPSSYQVMRLASLRRRNEFLRRSLKEAVDERASWEALEQKLAEEPPTAVRARTATTIVGTLTRIEEVEAAIEQWGPSSFSMAMMIMQVTA